jgi:hypothetical protein
MTGELSVSLNGFRIEFSSSQFELYSAAIPENSRVEILREELGSDWFIYWRKGIVYGLPRTDGVTNPFGSPPVTSRCEDYLWLLAARIEDALPAKFPKYKALRRRPFSFLGGRDEIVTAAARKFSDLPSLITLFKESPKFELDAKLVEFRDGESEVGLFVRVSTKQQIAASLTDLIQAGVDLKGLYVIRRTWEIGQRRLVGRFGSLSDGVVKLSEHFPDEPASVAEADVSLEPSTASFRRCLGHLLGDRYAAFEKERNRQEMNLLNGPAVHQLMGKMKEYLREASPLALTGGLECSITERIEVRNTSAYKSVSAAAPVEHCFDAARTKRHRHPWSGLQSFGPFSHETFPRKSPNVLVMCPDAAQGVTETFLRAFRDGLSFPRNSGYVAGFARTFGLANIQFSTVTVPLLENRTRTAAQLYRETAAQSLASSPLPDAGFVVMLDEYDRLPDPEDPYLQVKALFLMAGVPVQEVRLSTMKQSASSLQYILQNLAVALYAKMGGTPWTVDHDLTINDEIVIGMGTCELSSRFAEKRRYVGITTVFRGDGNYLLSNLSRECEYDDYPSELKSSTIDVLNEIKARNGWRAGDTVRIVFHSYKPLRNVEVSEIMAESVRAIGEGLNIQFAFLTVSHDHPFLALDLKQQGISRHPGAPRKGEYAPDRGVMVRVGRYTQLLCTNGPRLIKREESPLPIPLLVHLHPQSTFRDLPYLTEQVLKFTSLSWRSVLPARNPVTIYYSELIARLLARLRVVKDWSPAMLNVRLRSSKWFL